MNAVLSVGRRPDRWLVEVLVAALLAVVAVEAIQAWDRADAENNYPVALSTIAVDVPGLGTDGFLNATAADLNAIPEDQTLPGISVRYVTAGQLSTGQFVVSVNPISPTLWAAVALGPDGRCYGALASDPDYSNTTWNEYFARFPAGTPCRGSIATAATVTDNYQPG